MRNRFMLAFVLVAITLASGVSLAKDPKVKKLKKAPTRVAVAGATLMLEAHLWRESDAAPLSAVLKLRTTAEEDPLPAGIEVDRVWVVKRKEMWSPAQPRGEIEMTEPGKPRSIMNVELRDGPKWKTGTKVLCVARIKMLDGSEGLLKSDKTVIATSR